MPDSDKLINVDIAIPAYNEEHCIANILEGVLSSDTSCGFCLRNVYVISDSSTDGTHDIVTRFQRKDKRVHLVVKAARKGKNDSINLAFGMSTADVLVMLDADIQLATTKTLGHIVMTFRMNRVGLVGANVRPDSLRTRPGVAVMARSFDWLLERERRRRKRHSYWSFYGRALAVSRELFQGLVLPLSHADDLFIYFSCIRNGLRVAYANEAIIYFKAPNRIKDFIDQYSRFEFWKDKARAEFGRDHVDDDLRVRGIAIVSLRYFVRHPWWGFSWLGCQVASQIAFRVRYRFNALERGHYKTWVIESQVE